jgi:hypothetical protein
MLETDCRPLETTTSYTSNLDRKRRMVRSVGCWSGCSFCWRRCQKVIIFFSFWGSVLKFEYYQHFGVVSLVLHVSLLMEEMFIHIICGLVVIIMNLGGLQVSKYISTSQDTVLCEFKKIMRNFDCCVLLWRSDNDVCERCFASQWRHSERAQIFPSPKVQTSMNWFLGVIWQLHCQQSIHKRMDHWNYLLVA